MVSTRTEALQGRTVVVTRPAAQAESLCAAIEALGARVIRFPVLALEACSPEPLTSAADVVIFVSANAVRYGLPHLCARQRQQALICAVGEATRAALEEAGCADIHCPADDPSSEGLLQLPVLQRERIAGRRVLIVRGQGGRALLKETLRKRGAQPVYLEVYRRSCPATDPLPLLQALLAGELDALVLTSGEALQNFQALLPAEVLPEVRRLPLVVFGPRLQQQARAAGFSRCRVSTHTSDAGILETLKQMFA